MNVLFYFIVTLSQFLLNCLFTFLRKTVLLVNEFKTTLNVPMKNESTNQQISENFFLTRKQ